MRGTVIYSQYDEKTGQLIFAEHICRMRRERLIRPTVRFSGRPDKTNSVASGTLPVSDRRERPIRLTAFLAALCQSDSRPRRRHTPTRCTLQKALLNQ